MAGNEGDDKEEIKIRNKYPNAVLEKYKQSVKELEFINANENRIEFYKKKFKKHKRSRFFAKSKNNLLAQEIQKYYLSEKNQQLIKMILLL